MTIPDIIEFVTDPQLLGLTISPAQEVLLRGIYALPMTPEQREIFRLCTGREEPPAQETSEVTVISGARSGKDSRIATPIAAYEAAFGKHDLTLSAGETGVIAITCQDLRATQVTFGYLRAYFEHSPVLRTMLTDEPRAQSLDLVTRLQVRCFPTTTASMRSWSIPVGILNEPAFYRLEGAANSDAEIQTSMRRGMVGFARTKLTKISTPYMKSGILFDDFTRSFGQPDPDLLVWRSTTALMNPTIASSRLEQQRRLDPVRFSREFEAEFADDVAAFVPRDWIDASVRVGRFELPPNGGVRAVAAIDPSGGGLDAFTFAIVFVMRDGSIVQAVMRGQARQGSTAPDLEGLVRDYMGTARQYGCKEVVSDKYAAGWVRQAVERHQMRFVASEYDRSQAYLNLEPLLAQGRIELLDHPAMIRELSMLERRPRPGGKDVVEHPRGGHDDYINAVALAATYATLQKPRLTLESVSPYEEAGLPDWQRPFFGIKPRRADRSPFGIVAAPRRSVPSDALLSSREERARRDAADRAWYRAQADVVRKQREREKFEQLHADVHRFGSDTVEHFRKQRDPGFELPPDLRGVGPSSQKKEIA